MLRSCSLLILNYTLVSPCVCQAWNRGLSTAVSKLASLLLWEVGVWCCLLTCRRNPFQAGKSAFSETAAQFSGKERWVCAMERTFWCTRQLWGTSTGRKQWTTDTARPRWQRRWHVLAVHGSWCCTTSVRGTNPAPCRKRETRTTCQSWSDRRKRLCRTVV